MITTIILKLLLSVVISIISLDIYKCKDLTDNSTLSNYKEVAQIHLDLNLTIDFDKFT